MNDGVYLLDNDVFLDFMEALKEHYEDGDVGGVCGLFDDLVNGEKCNFYKDVGDGDD